MTQKTKAYETYNLVEYDKDLPYKIGDLVQVTFASETGLGGNEDDWLKVVRKNSKSDKNPDVGESTSINAEFLFDKNCVKAVKPGK